MKQIVLPDDVEAWARSEVAAGRAGSVEDLVLDAVSERRERGADIAALIERARAQAAEGRTRPGAAVAADLRRRAAELRERAEAEE